MKFQPRILLFLMISAILSGCTYDHLPAPEPIGGCDPNHVYFENDVLPIIQSNCAKSGCHDAASHAEGYNLSTYNGIMKGVKPGKMNSSKIYQSITTGGGEDRMPPAGNPPLTQAQISTIGTWIQQGALNDHCTQDSSGCLTTGMSYLADIGPILSANCTGCHTGSSAYAGVDLSTWSGAAAVAQTGKLYNSVAQNGLAISMPPSYQLSACDISKIKSWVDDGALNN
ncbi:MAG: hypothetical protein H6581_11720 [Bacteroidia bacterium]|nr:hypothetical protein [Bacteroidia bacterium]